jgi:hypothetical protein
MGSLLTNWRFHLASSGCRAGVCPKGFTPVCGFREAQNGQNRVSLPRRCYTVLCRADRQNSMQQPRTAFADGGRDGPFLHPLSEKNDILLAKWMNVAPSEKADTDFSRSAANLMLSWARALAWVCA